MIIQVQKARRGFIRWFFDWMLGTDSRPIIIERAVFRSPMFQDYGDIAEDRERIKKIIKEA